MGNLCGNAERQDQHTYENQMVCQQKYNDINIMIIHGDILEENSEILINCFTDIQESKTIKQIQQVATSSILTSYKEQLFSMKPEDILVQDYQKPEGELSLRYVIHYKVPNFQYNSDLIKYYNGYKECLEKAQELKCKLVSIDDCCCKSNHLPRQYNSEVLLKSVMHFIEENPNTPIQYIKINSFSNQNVKFLMYELDKYLEEVKVKDFAQRRRQVFFRFINPTQNDMSVIESEQEMNRNDFSFSEIKLRKPEDDDQVKSILVNGDTNKDM